jgi:hypothetical protein
MKKIFSILSFISIMTFGTLKAQNVEDVLDVKSFNFQGTDYHLGWGAHNSQQCIQEYFPKGQVPESYTDMFTISVFTNIDSKVTPEIAAAAKEAELAARKEKTKDVLGWDVMVNDDINEACIDFVCVAEKNNEVEVLEYDAHRYRMIQVDGKPALQLLFYSKRAYREDVTKMKDNLKETRLKVLNDITNFNVNCNVKLK